VVCTPWNVFSLNFDTKITSRLNSNTKLFGLVGERNSVGFTATPNIVDAVNPATNSLANRRVDLQNFGVENRNILEYDLGKTKQNLAFGARLYKSKHNQTTRTWTTGSDFDLSIEEIILGI
jgi:Fe(3+) dicitrate transport protein